VSPGVVEGVARVMSGADDGELDDGEILVCHTTDPSWAPLFLLASALVVDIGGAMSHCALVAREIGLPCVINTGDGTTVINTGDRIRVDGDAGTVEVLRTPTISSKGRTPEPRLHLPGEPSAATAD
jgi:pyruvate,water dikinase